MNNKIDQVPDEFKKLAEDFSKNGFITTSLDNLVNWSRSGSTALDDFWASLLCG
jgi:NADH-quinone oxidoreductase subunit B